MIVLFIVLFAIVFGIVFGVRKVVGRERWNKMTARTIFHRH